MYSEELDLEGGPWIPYEEYLSESVSPEDMLDLYRVPGPGGSFQLVLPPPPSPPGDGGASGGCRLHGGQPAATCSVIKVRHLTSFHHKKTAHFEILL